MILSDNRLLPWHQPNYNIATAKHRLGRHFRHNKNPVAILCEFFLKGGHGCAFARARPTGYADFVNWASNRSIVYFFIDVIVVFKRSDCPTQSDVG